MAYIRKNFLRYIQEIISGMFVTAMLTDHGMSYVHVLCRCKQAAIYAYGQLD